MNTFFAWGAYGRKANLKDWQSGKDFRSVQGYFSIRDIVLLKSEGYSQIVFLNESYPDYATAAFRVTL